MSHAAIAPASPSKNTLKERWMLLIGCIGVVYGDIGTSPLYAFREAVTLASGGGLNAHEIYGILSLIIWSLLIIVTLKYILFLLRADNNGEGGILSLMAMARAVIGNKTGFVFFAGVIGAALFYGDAAITPAISVLSAVEGLKLVTPAFEHYVLPLSMGILLLLFMAQKSGTGKVSILFGPITVIWFVAIAIAGLIWIVKSPDILSAFSPHYAATFLTSHGWLSFFVLGAVFLSVTGAEALYADLGHFGRSPIQRAWIFFVFPALVLNYLGQGALLISHPEAIANPFYLMVPEWALLPMVILATMATIIASQAVITGAFSLTRQAIQLGLLPRMEIRHTSATQEGQIYMPKVNLLLLFGVFFLCILFRTSSGLASAYGIAVTGTMLVTTCLAFIVVAKVWKKGYVIAALLTLPFIVIEGTFLAANMMKVMHGGFVPLLFAVYAVILIVTWVAGTRYLYDTTHRKSIRIEELPEKLNLEAPHVVPGTAIFLTSDPLTVPDAFIQNMRHNKVVHEHNIILTVKTVQVPKISIMERLEIHSLTDSLTQITVTFGYMETPHIPNALHQGALYGFPIDVDNATFFLGRRKIFSDPARGLPVWQDKIYIALSRSAVAATDFYRIPHAQAVEFGIQMGV